MQRRYLKWSIEELEVACRRSPADEGLLREILHELLHRTTKRAMALQFEIMVRVGRTSPAALMHGGSAYVGAALPPRPATRPLPAPAAAPAPRVAAALPGPAAPVTPPCNKVLGGTKKAEPKASGWGCAVAAGIVGLIVYAAASAPGPRGKTQFVPAARSTPSHWVGGAASVRGGYRSGGHTTSHGGHYVGGAGSSHRGGHYVDPRGGHTYGRHR